MQIHRFLDGDEECHEKFFGGMLRNWTHIEKMVQEGWRAAYIEQDEKYNRLEIKWVR